MATIPISGGEPTELNVSLPNVQLRNVSADGESLLLLSLDGNPKKVWKYSIPSGKLKLLRTGIDDAVISPDDQKLATSAGNDLSVVEFDKVPSQER